MGKDQRRDQRGPVEMDRQTVRAAINKRPEEDAIFAVCEVLETIVRAEFAERDADRARDAKTMAEVRKLLGKLRGAPTQGVPQGAFWGVVAALAASLIANVYAFSVF